MQENQNRLTVKQQLLKKIKSLKNNRKALKNSPITDLEIPKQQVEEIKMLTQALEKNNSFFRPLLYATNLLEGAWLLQYSTAREIRSLRSLPFGLMVGEIYQTIDVNNASFENKAWVEHSSGLLSGYVRVTANFEPALETEDKLPDRKINVDFKQRFLSITKVLGIKTKFLEPFRVVQAQNPQGRIPSLNITYIDETMRIGRGGDGSLFILTKA
jgi:hypothetical protein